MVACMCELTDYDAVKCWTTKWRVASKKHTCCECHCPIVPGERYRCDSGVGPDNDPFSHHTCSTCESIWDDRFGGDRVWGELSQLLWDCLGIGLTSLPDEDDAEEIDREDAEHVEASRRREFAKR